MAEIHTTKNYIKFHLAFWLLAGLALFISGYSQSNAMVSLTRNLYLFLLGGGATFLLIAAWPKIPFKRVRQSWLVFLAASYLIGTLIIIPINPVTYGQLGIDWSDLTWQHLFAGSMNFSMVLVFWGICLIFLFETKFKFPGSTKSPLLNLAPREMHNQAREIEIENKEGTTLIPLKDISHIKAAADYVEIILLDSQTHLKRATIQSMEKQLKPYGFLQVHRSIIINRAALEGSEGFSKGAFTLVMGTGERLKTSRRYKNRIEKVLA